MFFTTKSRACYIPARSHAKSMGTIVVLDNATEFERLKAWERRKKKPNCNKYCPYDVAFARSDALPQAGALAAAASPAQRLRRALVFETISPSRFRGNT